MLLPREALSEQHVSVGEPSRHAIGAQLHVGRQQRLVPDHMGGVSAEQLVWRILGRSLVSGHEALAGAKHALLGTSRCPGSHGQSATQYDQHHRAATAGSHRMVETGLVTGVAASQPHVRPQRLRGAQQHAAPSLLGQADLRPGRLRGGPPGDHGRHAEAAGVRLLLVAPTVAFLAVAAFPVAPMAVALTVLLMAMTASRLLVASLMAVVPMAPVAAVVPMTTVVALVTVTVLSAVSSVTAMAVPIAVALVACALRLHPCSLGRRLLLSGGRRHGPEGGGAMWDGA
mmetsp:Transcript_30971/g.92136  ORF Transcript_30971/g.92136 Transcript_30971/m.92136 type:complete len:286 (+) Transcript_30971:50-907(+)